MFTVMCFIVENHFYLVIWFQNLKNGISRLIADKSEGKGSKYILEEIERRQTQLENQLSVEQPSSRILKLVLGCKTSTQMQMCISRTYPRTHKQFYKFEFKKWFLGSNSVIVDSWAYKSLNVTEEQERNRRRTRKNPRERSISYF